MSRKKRANQVRGCSVRCPQRMSFRRVKPPSVSAEDSARYSL